MGWFGLFESRAEGMLVTELVAPSVLESGAVRKAALFGKPRPFPNVAYRRQP